MNYYSTLLVFLSYSSCGFASIFSKKAWIRNTADQGYETIGTDGDRIQFSPKIQFFFFIFIIFGCRCFNMMMCIRL